MDIGSQATHFFVTHRGLLDTLCTVTGTTPGITLIGQYPCNDTNIFRRTAYLARQLPATFFSFVAATHPSSGQYPNEIWLLHCCCILFGWACLLVMWPRLYLCLRPWMWNMVILTGTLSPCLGLLTHPHAPPGLFWTSHVPIVGFVLHFTQILSTVSALKCKVLPAVVNGSCSFAVNNVLQSIVSTSLGNTRGFGTHESAFVCVEC